MNENDYRKLAKIYKSVAHENALKILLYFCDPNSESGINALKALGFSEKAYYSRLNKLVDAGVIIKKGGGNYKVTLLGESLIERHEKILGIIDSGIKTREEFEALKRKSEFLPLLKDL